MSKRRPNRTPRPGPRPAPYVIEENHQQRLVEIKARPIARAVRAIFGVHVVDLGIVQTVSARNAMVLGERPVIL